jgi:hypothetical protein
MLPRPPFLTSLVPPSTAASNATGSTACHIWTLPTPPAKKFKTYPIGYFHIDLTEVRTEEGKLYLFVVVNRTSKYAFARLVEKPPAEPSPFSSKN